jgi:hypothetical protein
MNQEGFVDGSVTDENPVLLAKISDQNGINTVGNGIGHDIVAVLDGQTAQPFVLNDFYTSDLDSYQSGEVRYQFQNLSPGAHTLSLKVWDVNNNSSTAEINFVVQAKEAPILEHVLIRLPPARNLCSSTINHVLPWMFKFKSLRSQVVWSKPSLKRFQPADSVSQACSGMGVMILAMNWLEEPICIVCAFKRLRVPMPSKPKNLCSSNRNSLSLSFQ